MNIELVVADTLCIKLVCNTLVLRVIALQEVYRN